MSARHLRLFREEEQGGEDLPPLVSANMTLCEFVREWHVPVRQRKLQPLSQERLGDTLKLWHQLLGGAGSHQACSQKSPGKCPPVAAIDDLLLAQFEAALEQHTYRKGKAGRPRPYKRATIEVHLRNLQGLLHCLGPRVSAKRPTAKLLPEAPALVIVKQELEPKPPFAWEDVQRIFLVGIPRMTKPVLIRVPPADFWRGWEGWLFACGQRPGTVWNLQWKFLQQDRRGWLLDIPAEFVTKERKRARLAVPQWAVDAIAHWPRTHERIFACDVTYGTLASWHEQLQQLAGVQLPLEPRAWRRTYTEVLKMMGVAKVQDLMRSALDHVKFSTTRQSYSLDPVDEFRRMLPCPWEAERQKQLFN